MQKKVFLSVIIPAYNEEANVESTLADVAEYLKSKDFSYEVILVDDGSKDSTVEKAKTLNNKFKNFRIIESIPNRGKGFVVKKAMLQSNGDYAMFMDADNSTSIREFDKFLPYLEEGYDVVIGSRRLKDSKIVVPESILRIIMGNTYILLSKILLGVRVSDFNCGFKAYKSDAAKKVFSLQKMNDWSFDTELLFIITRLGLRIKEVPVKWTHKFTSKVEPLKAGVQSFLSLVRIKMNGIKGVYD